MNILAVLRVSAHLDRQLLRNLVPKKYFITSVFPPLPESCAIDNYLYTVLYLSELCCWVGGLTKLTFKLSTQLNFPEFHNSIVTYLYI